MAAIYDQMGDTITEGLQGCERCDEALIAARRIARDRGVPVYLTDDDGDWIVNPDGSCESIAPAEPGQMSDQITKQTLSTGIRESLGGPGP